MTLNFIIIRRSLISSSAIACLDRIKFFVADLNIRGCSPGKTNFMCKEYRLELVMDNLSYVLIFVL